MRLPEHIPLESSPGKITPIKRRHYPPVRIWKDGFKPDTLWRILRHSEKILFLGVKPF